MFPVPGLDQYIDQTVDFSYFWNVVECSEMFVEPKNDQNKNAFQ